MYNNTIKIVITSQHIIVLSFLAYQSTCALSKTLWSNCVRQSLLMKKLTLKQLVILLTWPYLQIFCWSVSCMNLFLIIQRMTDSLQKCFRNLFKLFLMLNYGEHFPTTSGEQLWALWPPCICFILFKSYMFSLTSSVIVLFCLVCMWYNAQPC